MATLSVWKFDSSDGAADALLTFKQVYVQQLVQLQDAAIISWPQDANKPSITPLHSVVGSGSLGGSFWGALFALLFLVPLLGAAIGVGFGALLAATTEVGLDERVVKELRDKITRGSSALCVLTTSAVTDQVLEAMKSQHGHAGLIESNLTREQESRLRKVFAAEPADEPPGERRPAAAA